MHKYNPELAQESITKLFDQSALYSLMEYIRIPNLSRSYDPQWDTNGKLQQAAQHIKQWIEGLHIHRLKTQIIKQTGYSPIIFTQIQGLLPFTLLFYGHYDKQPPFTGWAEGFGPTQPVIKDGKLYGRGGADDGYSTYGTMIAIKAIQQQHIPLPRCVMITEGDQQSGSAHLFHYLDKLKQKIGDAKLIFCLDSGTLDYDRFWLTNSLRGNLVATLRVQALTQGIHSGDASGVVPSSFRIANMLLNRVQNIQSGEFHRKFKVDIPENRYHQNFQLSKYKGEQILKGFPFHKNTTSISNNPLQCLLNRGWGPTLSIIGQKQLPPVQGAGNVMLPAVQLRFSIRLPPTLNSDKAVQDLKQLLTTNVPYNAHAQLKNVRAAKGWNSPKHDKYLSNLIQSCSKKFYGNQWLAIAEGGSIPIMNKFSEVWPNAQFIITGVLGPHSNAHGPNQFLHLDYTRKLICCMSFIVAGVAQHESSKTH